MECFEWLVLANLKKRPVFHSCWTYCENRSREDEFTMVLHSIISHLDKSNTYERMLFADFIAAFNTTLCSCTFDFLTNRTQHNK